MPWLLLDVCEQRRIWIIKRIWIINVNLLDWLGDHAVGWQHVNQLGCLKSVAGVFSNPDVMMNEIMWQRLLVSAADLVDWKLHVMDRLFEDWEFKMEVVWLLLHLTFGWKLLLSSPENPCLKIIPSQVRCYVFLLHQAKERKGEKMGMEEIEDMSLFGSLAGAICQSSWLARHEISVIVIGHRCQGWHGGLLQVGLVVWSPTGSVWFQLRGLQSFPDSVHEVGVGAVLSDYRGGWLLGNLFFLSWSLHSDQTPIPRALRLSSCGE